MVTTTSTGLLVVLVSFFVNLLHSRFEVGGHGSCVADALSIVHPLWLGLIWGWEYLGLAKTAKKVLLHCFLTFLECNISAFIPNKWKKSSFSKYWARKLIEVLSTDFAYNQL